MATTLDPLPPYGFEVDGPALLRDGAPVWIRRARSSDGPAMREFLEHVSGSSLEARFFASIRPERAGEELMEYPAFEDRVALVAVVGTESAPSILAHAAFAIVSGDPSTAEVAFLVRDAFQGHGLATILLHRLATVARALGILRFVAYVRPENEAMLSVVRNAGFPVVESLSGGTIRAFLSIVEPPAEGWDETDRGWPER